MKVFILCGGFGTRLAGLGGDLPKPMVQLGGRPIVWHIMKGFAHWGFSDFVLCLGHRSDAFKQYFLNLPLMVGDVTVDLARRDHKLHDVAEESSWRVTLAETGVHSLTGYRIKRAATAFLEADDDLFAVTYGDGVCDVDFRRVVDFHRSHGRLATLTAVHPPGRFGELTLSRSSRVDDFSEKPPASATWISGGFFVFSRAFLEQLPDDPAVALERGPLHDLAQRGELMAYTHDGFWFCMDSPRDHEQLSEMWASDRAPWAVWNAEWVRV
ncbi:MAG TPA: sugar phosphate nucleotidyltransferase [Vicinamibacterales bacterium]